VIKALTILMGLDIKLVLEPLWARLLVFARSLEGLDVPEKPVVVVAADDSGFLVQTSYGIRMFDSNGTRRSVGEVLPYAELHERDLAQ